MDHHFTVFADARAAFRGEDGQPDARPFLELALAWLNDL